MILIWLQFVPPYWLKPYVATHESVHILNNQSSTEISKENLPNTSQLETKESREVLKRFLRARLISYGIEDQYNIAESVITCESNWRINVYSRGHISYGVAQFRETTFDWFSKMKGKKLNYYNPYDQLDLLAWAFSKGYQNHWDCYSGKR